MTDKKKHDLLLKENSITGYPLYDHFLEAVFSDDEVPDIFGIHFSQNCKIKKLQKFPVIR